ncbi:MAG: phage tail assembly protein [Bradyrhizobium sp.]
MADENLMSGAGRDLLGEFPLSRPIKAYDEEVDVLKVRRPTAIDLIQIGNPVLYTPGSPPRIELDFVKLIAFLARLSQVPSSSLERLDPQDLIEIGWSLAPFLVPGMPRPKSNDAST